MLPLKASNKWSFALKRRPPTLRLPLVTSRTGWTDSSSLQKRSGPRKRSKLLFACCVTQWSLPLTASEQHARCDHLDVERREACGLCPSSSKRDLVLELQRTGLRQTLWMDPDHIHAGARLDVIRCFRFWTVHGDISDEYWTHLLFVF